MKHLGDITKINGGETEPVWCITFGSPCQDLSIAGFRKGLSGERSGLFMEAVRIIKEMRERDIREIRGGRADKSVRPRFAIWENVTGAYSSNNGEDFRCVLEELIRIKEPGYVLPRPADKKGRPARWKHAGLIVGDEWSIAYRTMDAQYWGCPQRRNRIAVVMDLDGQCAGEILIECTSVSGDPVESVPAWKGIARDPKDRPGEGDTEWSCTLQIRCGCDGGGAREL